MSHFYHVVFAFSPDNVRPGLETITFQIYNTIDIGDANKPVAEVAITICQRHFVDISDAFVAMERLNFTWQFIAIFGLMPHWQKAIFGLDSGLLPKHFSKEVCFPKIAIIDFEHIQFGQISFIFLSGFYLFANITKC